jgi:tetratricopeptide (TPR) repeat protein
MSNMKRLEELLIKREKVAFFVGTGISFDPPSMLPSWTYVAEGAIKSLYSKNLKDEQEELVTRSKKLRPEVLLGIMYEIIGDKAIKCLDILKSNKFNTNHVFLASAILDHNIPVITTNYDELIELAAERIFKRRIQEVYYDEDGFNRWLNSDEKPASLIKLHGTISNKQSIQAVLSQVAAGPSETIIKLLKYLFENYSIIFWGYSLTDDFDIVPALRNVCPEEIVWLRHKEEKEFVNDKHTEKIEEDLEKTEEKLSECIDELMLGKLTAEKRKEIHDEIYSLRREVNYGRLLNQSKCSDVETYSPQFPISIWEKLQSGEREREIKEFFNRWSTRIDEVDKLLINAEILFYLQEERETFKKVIDLCDGCINILQAQKSIDIEKLLHAYFLKGWAHRLIGGEHLSIAIESFKRALDLLKEPLPQKLRERKGYILHQMGQAFHRMGNITSAIEKLNEALKIREELRNIPDIAYTEFQIFYIKDEMGEYKDEYPADYLDSLKDILSNAQKELDEGGDVKGASIMAHNIAYIYQQVGTKNAEDKLFKTAQGQLREAIKSYTEVIKGRRLIFDTAGIVMANLRLGQCRSKLSQISFNLGNLEQTLSEINIAWDHHKKAKEGYVRMKKEPYRQKAVAELEKEIRELENKITG